MINALRFCLNQDPYKTHLARGVCFVGRLIVQLLGFAGLMGLSTAFFSAMASPRLLMSHPTENPIAPNTDASLVGAASCSASGCHNANGAAGTKGSEYSTWIGADPHAQAFAVLGTPRSKKMLANYKGLDLGQADPQRDPLCLSCHVHPDPEIKGKAYPDRFSVVDGVGCEACHGGAAQWVSTHYQASWKELSNREKTKLGFVDTKDLVTRAETCVRCHVGEKGMDVNHDLLAAGHPRLRFELSAYQANYSGRHWRILDEKARQPDYEWTSWLVGQLATTEAALDLLSHRASHPDAPWPELSEYNCASCHHRIGGDFGQSPSAGKLRFGTWNDIRINPQSLPLAFFGGILGDDERKGSESLKKLMEKEPQNRDQIRPLAQMLSQKWTNRFEKTKSFAIPVPDFGQIREWIMAQEKANQDGTSSPSWDKDTQSYLLLRAYLQNVKNRDGKVSPALDKAVSDLGEELGQAFPKGKESIWNSPEKYQANSVRKRFKAIQEALP